MRLFAISRSVSLSWFQGIRFWLVRIRIGMADLVAVPFHAIEVLVVMSFCSSINALSQSSAP